MDTAIYIIYIYGYICIYIYICISEGFAPAAGPLSATGGLRTGRIGGIQEWWECQSAGYFHFWVPKLGPWDHGWVPNSIGHVGVLDKLQYHCSRTPWVPKLGPWGHCWVPKYVIWAALGLHFGTLGTYLCGAGHPMGHSGVHIEIYMDLGWILGVHWDLLWGHLGDILMICDTKVTVWVAGWVFRRF